MKDLAAVYEAAELFPVFANRLLSKSRPEYEAFIKWSGFDPAHPPDPLTILGVTEGIRRTDLIEVFPGPVRNQNNRYLNTFFLHGLRYMAEAARQQAMTLQPGERLLAMLDPCNDADPEAVALRTEAGERMLLGYVPRYLARDGRQIIDRCHPDDLQIFVHRVNGDAPWQHRLLCRMEAAWPAGFKPCSGPEFQAIPAVAETLCAA